MLTETATLGYDDRARQVAEAVQRETGVEICLLFGSRARGDYLPDSDIDLLVAHPDVSELKPRCWQAARDAVQEVYGHPLGMDVVVLSSRLFSIMQYGCNHVAAHAARDGVTPMGLHYRPPAGEPPLSEPFRLEAMERVWQATNFWKIAQAGRLAGLDLADGEVAYGSNLQSALENALKAVIAAYGKPYPKIHSLPVLAQRVQTLVPEAQERLQSPIAPLSYFAGPRIYDSPDLGPDEALDHLFGQVEQDLTYLLDLAGSKGGFEPWSVHKSDFRF